MALRARLAALAGSARAAAGLALVRAGARLAGLPEALAGEPTPAALPEEDVAPGDPMEVQSARSRAMVEDGVARRERWPGGREAEPAPGPLPGSVAARIAAGTFGKPVR